MASTAPPSEHHLYTGWWRLRVRRHGAAPWSGGIQRRETFAGGRHRAGGRGRWWVALAAACLLAGGAYMTPVAVPAADAAGGTAIQGAAPGGTLLPDALQEVRVAPGDTLWDLAVRYGPAGQDVRETVWQLRELNGLTHSGLQAGQRILVPVGGP